ncbi:MAG: ribose-phosphate diphosphokinase [Planctomycetota bacterium]|jgi:ribose-phosphate pyrophosphokinase
MKTSIMKVFTGNANPKLATAIADNLGKGLSKIKVGRFPDGEISLKVEEDVRGSDVFIVQPTCPPVNDNLLELLTMIDCFRRASAGRITTVIPYYGYARQDRKDEGRTPITAKLVANLIYGAGANRVLTMDLHAAQIQGFFDIPVDNLIALPVFVNYLKEKGLKDLVALAPDVGSSKRALAYAKRINCEIAIVEKRRESGDTVHIGHIIGDVKGKTVIIPDDIIATGGTMAQAARVAKESGAKDIYLCATHGLFCGNAFEKLGDAPLKEILVTDTINHDVNCSGKQFKEQNIRVLSVAPLLAEAMDRIHHDKSVSFLFR